MSAPVSLNTYRLAALNARIDRLNRLLMQAEQDARDHSTNLCRLRAFVWADPVAAAAAAQMADKMEGCDILSMVAIRRALVGELLPLQAEFDRLSTR